MSCIQISLISLDEPIVEELQLFVQILCLISLFNFSAFAVILAVS